MKGHSIRADHEKSSLAVYQRFTVKSTASVYMPHSTVPCLVGGLRSSADLVTFDSLAGELLGANTVSVGLALVADIRTFLLLLLLLLLGGNASVVLVADEALDTVSNNLAGLVDE